VVRHRARVRWTEDEHLSTQIDRRVAHFTGQTLLAQTIDDGLAAGKRGEKEVATERLGRAVVLATESGNESTLQLLHRVVEIEDAASGRSGCGPTSMPPMRWRSTRVRRRQCPLVTWSPRGPARKAACPASR
jgi:hypothetical protein